MDARAVIKLIHYSEGSSTPSLNPVVQYVDATTTVKDLFKRLRAGLKELSHRSLFLPVIAMLNKSSTWKLPK